MSSSKRFRKRAISFIFIALTLLRSLLKLDKVTLFVFSVGRLCSVNILNYKKKLYVYYKKLLVSLPSRCRK